MRSDLDELPDTTEADPATDADLQHLADKYFVCGSLGEMFAPQEIVLSDIFWKPAASGF